MRFITLSMFPDFFSNMKFSLFDKAIQKGIINLENYDIKEWGIKRGSFKKQVDDKPYGGGAGMVLMVEPVYHAIKHIKLKYQGACIKVIILSPKGLLYTQKLAYELARQECLVLVCPHYEGFDERIINFVDYEISIGNYLVSGGEIAACVIMDSVARLIPGFVGNSESLVQESFSKFWCDEDTKSCYSYLEYPQYTRPAVFIDDQGNEYPVPPILLSGDHKKIDEWRKNNSKIITLR